MALDGEWEGFYFEVYSFMGASLAIATPFFLAILIFYATYSCVFRTYSSRNTIRRTQNMVMK